MQHFKRMANYETMVEPDRDALGSTNVFHEAWGT